MNLEKLRQELTLKKELLKSVNKRIERQSKRLQNKEISLSDNQKENIELTVKELRTEQTSYFNAVDKLEDQIEEIELIEKNIQTTNEGQYISTNSKTRQKDQQSKPNVIQKTYQTKAYDFVGGKVLDENIVVNQTKEYDEVKATQLYIKAMITGFNEDRNAYIAYRKNINVHTLYPDEYNSSSDISGNAPGYKNNAGETAIPASESPLLLRKLIFQEVYGQMKIAWLTFGIQELPKKGYIEFFEGLQKIGGDTYARAEKQDKLQVKFKSFRTMLSAKSYAALIYYTQEMLDLDGGTTLEAIKEWVRLFGESLRQDLDHDSMNGEGAEKLLGLWDTAQRGKPMTNLTGYKILAPRRILIDSMDELTRFAEFHDYDIGALGGARTLMQPHYFFKAFETRQVGQGSDAVKANGTNSFGVYSVAGQGDVQLAQKMFKPGQIGVINYAGGTKFYAKGGANYMTDGLIDPYSYMNQNMLRQRNGGYFELAVEDAKRTVLIVDNFTNFANLVASTGKTNLSATFKKYDGTIAPNGEVFKVLDAITKKTLSSGTVAGDAGAVTFVVAGAESGQDVIITDSNGTVVGNGTLG